MNVFSIEVMGNLDIWILPIMQYYLLTQNSLFGFLDPENIALDTLIVLIGSFSTEL